jgi:hypothetical protein
MDETNSIVKAENIGLAFGEELTRGQKMEIVREYVNQNLAPYKKRAEELAEQVKSFTISNDGDRKVAALALLEIKNQEDILKELREKLLSRSKKEIKSIESIFNEIKKYQKLADDGFDEKLRTDFLDFEYARQAAQETQNAQSRKEQEETGEFIPEIVLPETERKIETDNGTVTLGRAIRVMVVDKPKMLSAMAGVHCECPYCRKEIVIGPTIPNVLVDFNDESAKKYYAASGIRTAPGLIIEEYPQIIRRKK